jgi:hypothetical protein
MGSLALAGWPRAKWAVLAMCAVAQFMVVLDVSIVNVALPQMRHDLGLTVTGQQWVVNAYTLISLDRRRAAGRHALLAASVAVEVFPKSNERRNDPSVEGARIPANRSPIAPCRSSSRSSMLSAPAAMPATIAGIFRCGLAPHGRPILTFS